jgi:predicted RNase H-like HicB family nuclease
MNHDESKYTYRIEWSEVDHAHIARCLEFPSLAAHGATPEAALAEIEFVVAESIRWLEEEHEIVPEPLSIRRYKGGQGGGGGKGTLLGGKGTLLIS